VGIEQFKRINFIHKNECQGTNLTIIYYLKLPTKFVLVSLKLSTLCNHTFEPLSFSSKSIQPLSQSSSSYQQEQHKSSSGVQCRLGPDRKKPGVWTSDGLLTRNVTKLVHVDRNFYESISQVTMTMKQKVL